MKKLTTKLKATKKAGTAKMKKMPSTKMKKMASKMGIKGY